MKKVTIKKAAAGLMVEDNQVTPLSSKTLMLKGKSHKKGGTDLAFNGQKVEAEAGEPVFLDDEGSLIIAGNMKNPLTNRKFKSDIRIIGEKEAKMETLLSKGTGLLNNSDPYDKWDVLKFNAGRVMAVGAYQKKQELDQSKNHLADIQEAMLERADELGVDPEAFSRGALIKAKNGMKVKAQNGLSLAVRNNNPGNLKYANWMKKYGAIKGQAGTDGGNFAVFPTLEQGQQAMVGLLKDRKYQNRTVSEAINRWTNNSPYRVIPDNIRGKKVKDLNNDEFTSLLHTITQGEDSKRYNWDGVDYTPSVNPSSGNSDLPNVSITTVGRVKPPVVGETPQVPFRRVRRGQEQPFNYEEPTELTVPTGTSRFNFNQIVPELYAAATNQPDPVFAQTYSPDLFQPYSVSFQDRRNLNNQTFRALSQRLSDNPEALSTLAAQKYEADNQINAEEFRVNQGIQNDITNKNINLLNDAELRNLQIADTQYTRQSTAKSKTRSVNQQVLNSISGKLAQHSLENQRLQVYENLYSNFRFNSQNNQNLEKVGTSGYNQLDFGVNGDIDFGGNPYSSKQVTRDGQGNIKSITEKIPSEKDNQYTDLRLNKSVSQILKDKDFLFDTKSRSLRNRNYSPLKGYDYSR